MVGLWEWEFLCIFAPYLTFGLMRYSVYFVLISMLLCPLSMRAQVTDSVDVSDYDISLDFSQLPPYRGDATVSLRLLRPCATISLSLIGTVDSVEINGQAIVNPNLSALPTAGINAGQVFTIRVWYHGSGWVESYGLGGLHLDNQVSYNLGVGFDTNPHVLGRALFPCRDNFHDKATYTLRMKTRSGWTAECGGICQSVSTDTAGCEHSVWRIDNPTSTYLVSVSQSAWTRIQDTVHSLYGDYPLTVGFRSRNEANVRRAFVELDTVVPMFERCFGPYRWGRIGYISTEKGSMEHVNNIALDQRFVASLTEPAQTTIAHELGHAWFGNLVTCATEGDMWINEGGASFTAEVSVEAVQGREASDDYYQRYLEKVLRTTHVTDGGYRALHGIPHSYTYGLTTYQKGWMVWHSLRGYLGEEVFYTAIKRLMERCAFGTLDAWQVRDSLSLYTGVDLTDFFNFHVFGTGFIDYRVDFDRRGCTGNQIVVNVESLGVHADHTQELHRVPVTFFSPEGDTAMRLIAFEGVQTSQQVELPFLPAFCVLDPTCQFSDAATVGKISLIGSGARETLATQHIMVSSEAPMLFHVEHHHAPAHGAMPYGVVRQAQRYWMLRGNWDTSAAVQCRFRYVRTGNSNSDYANLDRGFYALAASVDSLGLFYREASYMPWRLLPSQRIGTANEGWIVSDSLLPGEYTLVVVDTARLSIENSGRHFPISELNLFPNPLQQGQPLTIDVASEEPFEVTIFDENGRCVWQKSGCCRGQKLRPVLTKGTYLVRIENNFLSLQSKLIQL